MSHASYWWGLGLGSMFTGPTMTERLTHGFWYNTKQSFLRHSGGLPISRKQVERWSNSHSHCEEVWCTKETRILNMGYCTLITNVPKKLDVEMEDSTLLEVKSMLHDLRAWSMMSFRRFTTDERYPACYAIDPVLGLTPRKLPKSHGACKLNWLVDEFHQRGYIWESMSLCPILTSLQVGV